MVLLSVRNSTCRRAECSGIPESQRWVPRVRPLRSKCSRWQPHLSQPLSCCFRTSVKWQISFRVSVVPGNLERKIITNIKQFSYNFVVPGSTLSASFHKKGHRLPGFCLFRKFLEVSGVPRWRNPWKLNAKVLMLLQSSAHCHRHRLNRLGMVPDKMLARKAPQGIQLLAQSRLTLLGVFR